MAKQAMLKLYYVSREMSGMRNMPHTLDAQVVVDTIDVMHVNGRDYHHWQENYQQHAC